MFHMLVFIKIPGLYLIFDLPYTPIAHQVLPVSLVDSVTAKVGDENIYLAYSIYIWYTSCCILFKYTFYVHSIYIPYTLKVKMKVKKWRPEKLKMVKKHFSPEMFGDLWGVICYHHWYPRAGLEGREKSYFSKKNEIKQDAELPPEYFPCGGSA